MRNTWTKDEILAIFDRNDKVAEDFICRSIVQIYNRQTEDEKAIKETTNCNGVGFNGVDANIMSSFAEFYLEKGYLSHKQMTIASNKIRKYAKQLADIANQIAEEKMLADLQN